MHTGVSCWTRRRDGGWARLESRSLWDCSQAPELWLCLCSFPLLSMDSELMVWDPSGQILS